MLVTEDFISIQGEGTNIGKQFHFLRLSGCNLANDCPINCDTKYSWKGGTKYTPEQLNAKLDDGLPLCVTGGEPLLQKEELSKLLELQHDRFVSVETNGTLMPSPELEQYVNWWSVSPKFGRIAPEVLDRFEGLNFIRNNVEFKFVVRNASDWTEVKNMRGIYDVPFVLQPEGTGNLLIDINLLQRLWKWQKRDRIDNTRILPQLHRLMYGNVRSI